MKTNTFILLAMLYLIVGCSKDNEEIPEPKTAIEIDAKRDFVRMLCGANYSFNILSEGEFTVQSLDPEVASVELEGSEIVISSKTPGKTNILIQDKNDPEREFVFRCFSVWFSHFWGEDYLYWDYIPEADGIYAYESYVAFIAEDMSRANDIRQELLEKSAYRVDTRYLFESLNEMKVITKSGWVKGTYDWDITNHVLTLNYNDRVEKYSVKIGSPPEIDSPFYQFPPFVLALSEDYTEVYASKYPELGIKKVTLVRYIMSYSYVDSWWWDEDKIRE